MQSTIPFTRHRPFFTILKPCCSVVQSKYITQKKGPIAIHPQPHPQTRIYLRDITSRSGPLSSTEIASDTSSKATMSSTTGTAGATVLGAKDANLPVAAAAAPNAKDSSVKSMEYHRQVLQSKMEAQQ